MLAVIITVCFDALNTAERVEEKEEENEEEEEKEKVGKINCVRNGIGIRNCCNSLKMNTLLTLKFLISNYANNGLKYLKN